MYEKAYVYANEMHHLIKLLCKSGIHIVNRTGKVDRTNIPKLIQTL